MTTATLEQTVTAFEIQKTIDIQAPLDITFQSILDEFGDEFQTPDGKSLSMKLEPWPGGRWFRDLGNKTGHLWGHVQVIKPPALLELCGPMAMSYPAVNHVQYRLTANGASTRLKLTHKAMGVIVPEHRDGMDEGWKSILDGIRQLAERKVAFTRGNRK
jgi:hypothetical protein